WYMNLKKIFSVKIFIVYAFVSLLYLFPAFKNMEIFGFYDTAFHINRALSLESIFSSPINFETFRSYGMQVNNFYPWLTLYPLFLLIKFTNLAIGYNLFLYIVTLITLFICHYVMYEITKKHVTSSFFAIIYTTSSFRSVEIFLRGAMGELLAMSILPLILLGFIKLYDSKKESWVMLAISMTLLIYTHVLSVAMTMVMIIIALIIQFYRKKKIEIFLIIKLIKAAIVTLLLSLAFIGPMIEQTLYQDLNRPYVDILQKRAIYLGKEFLIGSIDSELLSFGIGLTLLICLIILTFNFKKLGILSKITYIMGIISILLCTKIFPWFALQNTPLNIIQAPWRFMIFSTLFISFSVSLFISPQLEKFSYTRRRNFILLLILAISILNYSSVVNMVKEMNFQGTYSNEQMENKLEEFENFDYVPIGYKKDQLLLKNHQVTEDGQVIYSSFSPNKDEITFTLKSSKGKTIVLPVFRYKGLTVTVNSKNATVLKQGGPFVTVKSESGINKVTIRYSYTFFSKISLFISIITLIVLLFYCIKLKIRTSHE
ncbi:YfhO family protein, partial [Enterococcus faecium]|nr:YfhO family protein [Enterococcus faecium]MDT6602165.1 YfhO family protein [Enterococcus faecium]MDV4533101.1 YfhO family protein [Enterococcus faecium]MDV4546210.1 YfhO family protein [Enterococcus faecium]MDV4804076.1 YfhO family protein [Enterococcus faecium]